tara:strand:- start:54 stop:239 length:186 start_codon:yes stop_codon:yes gene_type:complete
MAKVTIQFEDKSDGEISVKFDADPAITPGEDSTPAQIIAMDCVEYITSRFGDDESKDTDSE